MKRKVLLLVFLMIAAAICSASSITLEQARILALKHDQQLQVSYETVYSTRSIKKAAFTYFLPALKATGDFSYLNRNLEYKMNLGLGNILSGIAIANPSVQSDPLFQTLAGMFEQGLLPDELKLELGQQHNYLGMLSLNQPLFTGGKIYNEYRLARLNNNLMEAGVNLKKDEIILSIDEAYWRLVSLHEKVRLAELYQSMAKAHLDDVSNYLAVNMATTNDSLKASMAFKAAELQLLKARDGCSLAMMELNRLTGQSLDNPLEPADTLITIVESKSSLPDIQEILSQRPEITALELGVRMSKTKEKVIMSDYMPSLMLSANYSFLKPNPYNSLENEFGADWQINLMAQWDIFHWNETGYKYSAARHNTRSNELRLNQAQELINLEVRQNLLKYNEAGQEIAVTSSNLAQAAENLRLTNDKFDTGMASPTDVLDAQTLWQKACSDDIEARCNFRLASTRLQKACGMLNREE